MTVVAVRGHNDSRDREAWQAHWSRAHGSDGTTFTTSSGQRMTFAPGPVWVVLPYG